MTTTTDQPVEQRSTPGPASLPTRALMERLLAVQARMSALSALESDSRAILHGRALAELEEQGVAPTWRAPGLGTVVLTDPQPKLAVNDPAAFAAWAAEKHPEHVTATLTVPGELMPLLLAVLEHDERFADADIEAPKFTVGPTWTKGFLERCAEVDGELFAPETGEPVPGAYLAPAAPRVLQVRLDKEAKNRAAAECVDEATVELFTAELGSLPQRLEVYTAELVVDEAALPDAETALALAEALDDADGEPEYDETPEESAAIVDANLRAMGSAGLELSDAEVLAAVDVLADAAGQYRTPLAGELQRLGETWVDHGDAPLPERVLEAERAAHEAGDLVEHHEHLGADPLDLPVPGLVDGKGAQVVLGELTVPQLREECRSRDLAVSGNKPTLQARLAEALNP